VSDVKSMKWALLPIVFMLLAGSIVASASEAGQAGKLFETHCAQCHGADRLGAIGPALLPQNLKRLANRSTR